MSSSLPSGNDCFVYAFLLRNAELDSRSITPKPPELSSRNRRMLPTDGKNCNHYPHILPPLSTNIYLLHSRYTEWLKHQVRVGIRFLLFQNQDSAAHHPPAPTRETREEALSIKTPSAMFPRFCEIHCSNQPDCSAILTAARNGDSILHVVFSSNAKYRLRLR
jgi:hypothetical protein